MDCILLIVISIAVLWGLCILQVASWVWFLALVIAAGSWQASSLLSSLGMVILWSVVALLTVALFLPVVRRAWFSGLVLRWFKKILPPMSNTERQAIESGDVWLEGQLFQGRPNWQELLALPVPQLTTEERRFIDQQVTTLCAMLDDWDITHKHLDLEPATWTYLKQEKFFGLHIPTTYGGLGFSALANSTIVQKIATRSLTAAVTVMVPNSLGPGELLLNYGTDQQRQQYLPGLASGKEIPCFALTGVEAGSDAAALQDTGVVCKGKFGGKEILGVRLNWNKRYITLAPIATLLGLAVKLYDPEDLLVSQVSGAGSCAVNQASGAASCAVNQGNGIAQQAKTSAQARPADGELGITVFLLPTTLAGIEIGNRHLPLNQAFMNGPIRGKDVFVPLEYIVGGAAMIGQGWRMLVECLSAGRGISLPALSTSSGKLSMRMAGAYAAVRKQFGMPIGKFEGIEAALARIGGYTYMLESMRLLTLTGIAQGFRPAIVTAISKYHMTEMGRQVINDAMDIHGGRGIVMGPRNYLARAYQGIPISITVEGANILTRNLIIFGQGAIRCHPYVKAEMEIANKPLTKATVAEFDRTLLAHISYTISNFARWKFHTFTGFRFSKTIVANKVPKKILYYCRELNRLSLALACMADVAMLVLGGSLKRKEHLSARLGDVLSYLYIGSAVLKYYYSHTAESAAEAAAEMKFVRWSLDNCLCNMQTAVLQFLQNFPSRTLAAGLKFLLFPFGTRYRPSSDATAHAVAAQLLQTSSLRERLASDCYINAVNTDPVGRMELALQKLQEVEPSLRKLEQAVKKGQLTKAATVNFATRLQTAVALGIVTNAEAQELTEYEVLRVDAIQVDDFSAKGLVEWNNGINKG